MGGDQSRKDLSDSGGNTLTVVWPSLLSMPRMGALGKLRREAGCGRQNIGPQWNKDVHVLMHEPMNMLLHDKEELKLQIELRLLTSSLSNRDYPGLLVWI